MAVYKRYTTKDKTRFNWRVVVEAPTGEFDRFGKPIKKQVSVGTFKTRKEAEKAEREYKNGLDKGTVELNSESTFDNVVQAFIEYAENEGQYAKGTVSNYKGYNKNHLQMFKFVPVKNITPILIQRWHRDFYQKGGSDHVFNGCVKLMKVAFNYAIRMKQINTNPFMDLQERSVPQKLRNRFSTEQLRTIINTCQNKLPEFYCLFAIATLTGARCGEYSALRPKDIDVENRRIYIYKQITWGEEKERTKKNASTRIVDISDKLLEIIQWHIKQFNISEDSLMFTADKGGQLYAKWVERKFKKLLELCKYPENYCRVHDLRGQYVDVMHLCGVPIEYISRQVGHSNSMVTSKVYTQILRELPVEANKLMDERIFGS